MKGTTNPILNAFDGNHKTLFIPVYQRNYDWQIKQCERLFQDLEDIIIEKRPKHFFGAVVGKPESWQWVVIDGQQRLTTVSLLMLALAKSLDEGTISSEDDELARKIEYDYLRIGAYKEETKFKLKPVKDDDKAYRRLFGPEKNFIPGSNITANYKYFRERLANTPFTADQIWEAIRSLEVMRPRRFRRRSTNLRVVELNRTRAQRVRQDPKFRAHGAGLGYPDPLVRRPLEPHRREQRIRHGRFHPLVFDN